MGIKETGGMRQQDVPTQRDPNELLTSEEVAEELSVGLQMLANWRYAGTGPAYIKLGPKTVRYRRAALEAWLEANTRTRTGDFEDAS